MPEITVDLKRIPYAWSLLTQEQQRLLLSASPRVAPLVSSLMWMRQCTKTWDEHDTETPYKRLPDYKYFDILHDLFLEESRLFMEKSRTVMATWWGCGESFHFVETHQPASCIFWCPDQDRAEKCIEYCKVLYAQQDDWLKELYPLPRKKQRPEEQAVYRFELGDGGWLEALPGKNPDKIRSEHPTIVFMDEAAFNERGIEAYGNAVSTRPKKLIAISSAYPGWFFDIANKARLISKPTKGVTISVIPDGEPAAKTKVVRLHYSADPTMTAEKVAEQKTAYPDITIWNREMEIDPLARSGQKVFSGFSEEQHVVDDFLPLKPSEWSVWMAGDPHPRRAHAFVWLAVNKLGEMVVPWSWWPEQENLDLEREGLSRILIEEYAKKLGDVAKAGVFPAPCRDLMDRAGRNFNASEEEDFFERYLNEGYAFAEAKKNRQYAGYDLINKALTPTKYVGPDGERLKPLLTIMRGNGDNDKLIWQMKNLRYKEYRGTVTDKDPPSDPMNKERHLIDCLSYILLDGPEFIPPGRPRDSFKPLYPSLGY